LESNQINYIPNTIAKVSTLQEFLIVPNPLDTINDDDVIWSCHNGYVTILLDFLAKQPIPQDYPFLDEVKKRKS